MQNVKKIWWASPTNSSGEITSWFRLIIMIHIVWSEIGEPNKSCSKVSIGFGVQILWKGLFRTIFWLLTYYYLLKRLETHNKYILCMVHNGILSIHHNYFTSHISHTGYNRVNKLLKKFLRKSMCVWLRRHFDKRKQQQRSNDMDTGQWTHCLR